MGGFSVRLTTIKSPSYLYSYQLEGGPGLGVEGAGVFVFVLKRGFFLVEGCLFVVGCVWRRVLLRFLVFFLQCWELNSGS